MISAKLSKQDLLDTIEGTRPTLPQDLNNEERGQNRATQDALDEETRLADAERQELIQGEEPEAIVDVWSGEIIAVELRLGELMQRQWDIESSGGDSSGSTRRFGISPLQRSSGRV